MKKEETTLTRALEVVEAYINGTRKLDKKEALEAVNFVKASVEPGTERCKPPHPKYPAIG